MGLAALDRELRRLGVRRHFRRGARLDGEPIALLAHEGRVAIVEPPLAGDERRLAPLRAQGFDVLDASGDPARIAARAAWLLANPQPARDRHFMERALAVARVNLDSGRDVPVGALVVRDGEILAEAVNGTQPLSDPTAHAELLALRQAAQAVGDWRLSGASLYVTLEPCAMCAGAILHARVARLVWAAADPRAGAVASRLRLPQILGGRLELEPIGGEQSERALQMLRAFFAARRERERGATDQKKR